MSSNAKNVEQNDKIEALDKYQPGTGSDEDEDAPNSTAKNVVHLQEHIDFHDGRWRRRAIFGNDCDSEGDEDGATSDDDIESSEEEEEDGNDNHDTNGVSFFVHVVAMEEAVLVLAFVGKLRRHLLLLVVAMVLVLLVSSFASPLSDEGVCARTLTFETPQITEHQSKFKDGEDIPPLVDVSSKAIINRAELSSNYRTSSGSDMTLSSSDDRGKNQVKASCNVGSWTTEMDSQPSGSAADVVDVNESGSSKLGGSEPEGVVLYLQDRLKWLNQQVIRKGHQSSPSSQDRALYERMLDNKVEFGSPNKRYGGFFNFALPMDREISLEERTSEDGFVKETASFIICDDLRVMPNSLGTSVGLFHELGAKNMEAIEERTVEIGNKEVLDLLKCSFLSKSPLTDFILNKKQFLYVYTKHQSQFEIGEVSSDVIRQMVLKVLIRKSDRKILFVEGQEDFADFIFSFLTLPLGGVLHMLGGFSSYSCLDKLYKSVTELCPYRYLMSPSLKHMLVIPQCAPQLGIYNQILQIGEA
ncbi:hypothetical protein JHK87_050714 [Glycine soja]|nr:hypothetical protein JHK87_050714 [Glycine soja]